MDLKLYVLRYEDGKFLCADSCGRINERGSLGYAVKFRTTENARHCARSAAWDHRYPRTDDFDLPYTIHPLLLGPAVTQDTQGTSKT